MKKFLSIIIAAVMAVSVFALSVVPAMAAETVNSPTAPIAVSKGAVLQVNGAVTKNGITFRAESVDGKEVVTYTYVGEGTLKGWEQNLNALGCVEGTDYTAVQNKDGSFTISYISDKAKAALDNGEVVVNAVVDLGTATTKTDATKANDSSKAPATGVSSSVVAGGVAVAFAGAAVLAATKKKDAE